MGCTLSSRSVSEQGFPPPEYVDPFNAVAVGMQLMCRDKFPSKFTGEIMYKWRKAEVVDRNGTSIRIHFTGWADTYDISLNLEKDISWICPIGLLNKKQTDCGFELTEEYIQTVKEFLATGGFSSNEINKFKPGDHVDILDIFYKKGSNKQVKKWRKAKVVSVEGRAIKITYLGWDSKFDEWLNIDKDIERISEFGTKSSEQTSLSVINMSPQRNNQQLVVMPTQGTRNTSSNSSHSSITLTEENGFDLENVDPKFRAEFEAEINREMVFLQKLAAMKLMVIDIDGDGNCLFRAISHQLFLTEDRHGELRQKCVEHMRKHRERFESFCSIPFDAYLLEMGKRGTWGDDLEIRALEEVFDRIVRIYSSNTVDVCVPLKNNFEEENLLQGVSPIILSYHGNSHYNSILDERHPLPLPPRQSSVLLRARMGLQSREQQTLPATKTKENDQSKKTMNTLSPTAVSRQ